MPLARPPGWNCPRWPNPLPPQPQPPPERPGSKCKPGGQEQVYAGVCDVRVHRRVSMCACMCAYRMCTGVSVHTHTHTHTHESARAQLPVSEQRGRLGHPSVVGAVGGTRVGRPGWDPLREGPWGPRAPQRHSSAHEPRALGRVLSALPGRATRGPFPPGLPVQLAPQQGLTFPQPQTTGIKHPQRPQGMQGRGVTQN